MYTRTRVDVATAWLTAYLRAHGPTDSRLVKTAATAAGIDERTVARARNRAKVWSVTYAGNATRWQLDEP